MNDGLSIELKGIVWEDMVNYKKICTTLMFPHCDFKCDKEFGTQICQNGGLAAAPSQRHDINDIMCTFAHVYLSEAIVLQGLEPLDDPLDVLTVAAALREWKFNVDLVIYTGYNKSEISQDFLDQLIATTPGRLIIKWGRYVPNQQPHYDPVLGVNLASDNQYAEVIKE